MNKKLAASIVEQMERMFPDAKCELNYETLFQLVVAVVLSAQTTDIKVNIVTKDLFSKFPDAKSLMSANIDDVKSIIKIIGLYQNKAKNIIALAKIVNDDFNGEIPCDVEKLLSLPGVGMKTCNVVLAEGFKIPAIAVDTHVHRVSKRLGFVKQKASVEEVEEKLKKYIIKDHWIKSHHLFIFFGRYHCKAQNPHCYDCPFVDICKNKKKKL